MNLIFSHYKLSLSEQKQLKKILDMKLRCIARITKRKLPKGALLKK